MCFCLCISDDTSNSLSSGSPGGSCILASMCILVQMNEIKQRNPVMKNPTTRCH